MTKANELKFKVGDLVWERGGNFPSRVAGVVLAVERDCRWGLPYSVKLAGMEGDVRRSEDALEPRVALYAVGDRVTFIANRIVGPEYAATGTIIEVDPDCKTGKIYRLEYVGRGGKTEITWREHYAVTLLQVVRRKIDAVLHDVCIVPFGPDGEGFRAIGRVEADTNGRFADGRTLQTSEIVGRWGNVLHTRNSCYFIASERKEPVKTAPDAVLNERVARAMVETMRNYGYGVGHPAENAMVHATLKGLADDAALAKRTTE